MMFIKVMILMVMTITGILTNNNVYAYDIPVGACMIHGLERNLGEITIYVPCNDTNLFSFTEDDQPVLVSNSNVTGYLSNTDDYTINFRPYYYGRYRVNNYGDYINLDFIAIYSDTNVNTFDDNTQYITRHKNIIIVSSLIFIGVVLCLVYMKR